MVGEDSDGKKEFFSVDGEFAELLITILLKNPLKLCLLNSLIGIKIYQ